jgi:hypothetical protein
MVAAGGPPRDGDKSGLTATRVFAGQKLVVVGGVVADRN